MWHEWGITKMHTEFWCLNVNRKDCSEYSRAGEADTGTGQVVLRCSAIGLRRLSSRFASTAVCFASTAVFRFDGSVFRSLYMLPPSRQITKFILLGLLCGSVLYNGSAMWVCSVYWVCYVGLFCILGLLSGSVLYTGSAVWACSIYWVCYVDLFCILDLLCGSVLHPQTIKWTLQRNFVAFS